MTDTITKKELGHHVPDGFFESLKNENKILKYNNPNVHASLTDDYLFFLNKIKQSNDSFHQIQVGDIVEGIVISLNKREIIIDINSKDNIFVDAKAIDNETLESLELGSPIKVVVTEINDNPYYIKGSFNDLFKLNISNIVKDHFNDNLYFYATVKESQPAGYSLDLDVEGQILEAFMPNTLAGVNKLFDPQSIVGQKFEVMIETLEQDKGVYVVSRKKYLEHLIPEKVRQLKKEWYKDKSKVYEGTITGTTPFGAFVEFYEYLTGMIHRYNINQEWQSDEKWSNLKPGMKIDFYIKEIISRKDKIILTQIIRDSLWDTIKVDDIVKGKVIVIKPFGALIQLDEETNGLIQNTYLQKNKIDLKVGQDVEVRVTSIMRDERKINLSLVK